MARSRRGGSSSGGGLFGSRKKEAPKPAARPAPPAPAAQPTTPAPMQQQPAQSGGMLSGIGSTIAQGMAFGTGSAIAHRAVGAVANSFGGDDSAPADQQQQQGSIGAAPMNNQQQQLQGPCAQDKEMFFDCLKVNQGDQQSCSFLYEQLQTCQRNQSQITYN